MNSLNLILVVLFLFAHMSFGIEICKVDTCKYIDICASNTLDQWISTSIQSLFPEKYVSGSSSYIQFDIDRIEGELGVDVMICEPNFAILFKSELYVCNDKTIQILRGVFNESNLSIDRRMQMVKYGFQDGYACNAIPEPGEMLDPVSNHIQRSVPCSVAVENGYYDQNCILQCEPHHNYDGVDKCVPQCEGFVEACGAKQRTIEICSGPTTSLFRCEDCAARNGHSLKHWVDGDSDSCEYDMCSAGTISSGYVCEDCGVNEWSSEGEVKCNVCETNSRGFYQPTPRSNECIQCFLNSTTTCENGRMAVTNFTTINAFFDSHAVFTANDKDMYKYCMDGAFCQPCPPGTEEKNGSCSSCEIGFYQNSFAQDHCSSCTENQTTLSVGSTSSLQCVCEIGNEKANSNN